MLDEVVTAVATGAAGNIVAYMLNGRVDALRSRVSRIFRRGTDQEQSNVLCALDHDVVALSERRVPEADLVQRWTDILLAHMSAHPESRSEVEAFANAPDFRKTANIAAQHNHGNGIFVGGDNYGPIEVRNGT